MAGKKSSATKKIASGEQKNSFLSPAGIKKFFLEVQGEFNKVSWPDKKIALGSTGVVILLVILLSVYLGTIDLILGKIIATILN